MNTSLINHAPEIKVSDRTLTVGNAFDSMENVVVKDKEDSANVVKIIKLRGINALLLPIQYNIMEIENRYIVSMKGAMTYGKISKSLCAN